MIDNKGDASIFWIIIGAVLALAILVILISIATNRVGVFNTDIQQCVFRGGTCQADACVDTARQIDGATCPKKDTKDQYCCVKVPG